jgi:hypothetical protein
VFLVLGTIADELGMCNAGCGRKVPAAGGKDAPVTRSKFSEWEASNHTPSLADFTTTTPELKFSVHAGLVSTYVI